MRSISVLSVISLSLILLTCCGCEQKGKGVDITTSVETLKAEAAKMDVAQLREKVLQYRRQYLDNQDKIIAAMTSMKDGKNILEGNLNAVMNKSKALQERYQIYYDRLVELKADVSDLSLIKK